MQPQSESNLPQGQESVWDYPRPPRLEPCKRRIRVECDGIVLADSARTLRMLETSHPPVYYIPAADILVKHLRISERSSWCEWKGRAGYVDLDLPERTIHNAAWFYAAPSAAYSPLRQHYAFYASKVDACFVDDERVHAQPGDFYGGWITSDIVGPFKGGPGTRGW
jgi:uncharacterized protein (DUF427 family)